MPNTRFVSKSYARGNFYKNSIPILHVGTICDTVGRMTCTRLYNATIALRMADYLRTYEELGEHIPTVPGLAVYIGVTSCTIRAWAKTHADVGEMLQLLNDMQETQLLNHGLDGSYNASIATLVLAKHGYKKASEVDHTNDGGAFEPMSLADFYDRPYLKP